MSDKETRFDLPQEGPSERRSFPWAIVVAAAVLLSGLAAWILSSRSSHSQEAAVALEQELTTDEAALQAQKDKVVQLSEQLDSLKLRIQTGQVQDRKKATDEYNALAKQQNGEREKYLSMATDYNAKVARYKQAQ